MLSTRSLALASLLTVLVGPTLVGCGNEEQGFCFPEGNCDSTNVAGSSSGGKGGSAGVAGNNTGGSLSLGGNAGSGGSAGSAGSIGLGGGGSGGSVAGSAGSGTCTDTTKINSCGTCDNDCTKKVTNVPIAGITCTMGKCGFDPAKGPCASNFYDLDKDPSNGCEFGPCKKTADKDDVCDGVDNDCDGTIDDEVDFCATATCGSCKTDCGTAFLNALAECVKTDPNSTSCSAATAKCEFKGICKPGFVDGDKDPSNGCEVKCTPTDKNGAPLPPGQEAIEFCGDNIDNDCDGKTDFQDEDTQVEGGPKTDPQLFASCEGGEKGECFAVKGKLQCKETGVVCVGSPKPGEMPEVCDGKDNDCNGFPDDLLTDAGKPCGASEFGICNKGLGSCVDGVLTCLGEGAPEEEVCNGLDDDCDDIIDGSAAGPEPYQNCAADADCPSGQVCRLRDSDTTKKVCALPNKSEGALCDQPPADTTNPCQAGKITCINAALLCLGQVVSTAPDTCGIDTNCNGVLENQPDLNSDPANCGACGNDCNAGGNHINAICDSSSGTPTCVPITDPATKCQQGFIDCDGNPNDCERACTFLTQQEVCNGVDDNCDCNIDEVKGNDKPNGIEVPTPGQACGVTAINPTDPACALKTDQNPGGVEVKCDGGKFVCTFPAGHCDQGSCAGTPDLCDGIDNDCNGQIDDNFNAPIKTSDAVGQPCASDDGKGQSDGECRSVGVYQCSPDKLSTVCTVKGATLKCGVAPGDPTFNQKPCDELCDGLDNDCDGIVDEPRLQFNPNLSNSFDTSVPRPLAPGANTGTYLKPEVVKIGDSLWINKYEVTRPKATTTTAGNGNGYWATGGETPNGVIPAKTAACNDPITSSNPGRIPWFNITPIEVEQTCNNMGGRICRQSEWRAACAVNSVGGNSPKKDCKWGYGQNCTPPNPNKPDVSSAPTTCNISAFDFDGNAGNGNQDGLLTVGSSLVPKCFSDWSGFFTNGEGANQGAAQIFDITGNLREITIVDSTIGKVKDQRQYALMGGAFNADEGGSACDFSFYTVASDFQLFSVGFRCCFDEYPD